MREKEREGGDALEESAAGRGAVGATRPRKLWGRSRDRGTGATAPIPSLPFFKKDDE